MNSVLNNDFEKVYTVPEVALMLKMHPDSVRRLIRAKKMEAMKITRDWRITHSMLKKFYSEYLKYPMKEI